MSFFFDRNVFICIHLSLFDSRQKYELKRQKKFSRSKWRIARFRRCITKRHCRSLNTNSRLFEIELRLSGLGTSSYLKYQISTIRYFYSNTGKLLTWNKNRQVNLDAHFRTTRMLTIYFLVINNYNCILKENICRWRHNNLFSRISRCPAAGKNNSAASCTAAGFYLVTCHAARKQQLRDATRERNYQLRCE